MLEREHRPDRYVDEVISFGLARAHSVGAAKRSLAAKVGAQIAHMSHGSANLVMRCLERRDDLIPDSRRSHDG